MISKITIHTQSVIACCLSFVLFGCVNGLSQLPAVSESKFVSIEAIDPPRVARREGITVWVRVKNNHSAPVAIALDDSVQYSVTLAGGAGWTSNRVFGARTCKDRHVLSSGDYLTIPIDIDLGRADPGSVRIDLSAEPRLLDASWQCTNQSLLEATYSWTLQVAE